MHRTPQQPESRSFLQASGAFSLIELVIVVVIIGILSGIAVPRMSSASENAARSAVIGNTSTMQRAIDLYAAEHEGVLPDKGSGSLKTFYLRLMTTTDLDGTLNDAGIYGPYIDSIPANTYNGLATIRINGAAAGADSDGWRYDSTSGMIEPDHASESDGFKINAGNGKIKVDQAAKKAAQEAENAAKDAAKGK